VTVDKDFGGCMHACQTRGEHTGTWGECEFGIRPEPSVSMSRDVIAGDGQPALAFDTYTAEQLAEDFIEPVLRNLRVNVGPSGLAELNRGRSIRPFAEEESGMWVALVIARAIVHRNDPPERIPIPGIPECGADCFCRRAPEGGVHP
jgi:hypothetical protein